MSLLLDLWVSQQCRLVVHWDYHLENTSGVGKAWHGSLLFQTRVRSTGGLALNIAKTASQILQYITPSENPIRNRTL